MSAWPEPEQSAVVVEPDDGHVPSAARLACARARGAGWQAVLTYARGTPPVGKACTPGPVAESVALRLRRGDGVAAVAVWEARSPSVCECGKSLMPTDKGVFRAHKLADGEACPGSGQVALASSGERKYAFKCAYMSESTGWWSSGAPKRVNATQFGALLSE